MGTTLLRVAAGEPLSLCGTVSGGSDAPVRPPEEDFWKVYEIADSVDKAFLLFLLHTAARRAEAFRLTWEDVDFSGRKIRLGTRKTGGRGREYAWIPMTTALRDALGEMKIRNRGNPLVFSNRHNGAQYTARQHMMPELCKAAGVKPFGFHAIRHLSATILAYEGMDIPSVQAVLRHKNPNTTARYIKSLGVQPDKIEAAFAKKKGAKVVPFAPPGKSDLHINLHMLKSQNLETWRHQRDLNPS